MSASANPFDNGQTRIQRKLCLLKTNLPKLALAVAMFGTTVFAGEHRGQEWVEVMNACEMLISKQSFDGFQDYSDVPSTLNAEPRLERGFQHPKVEVNASAIFDGSEWFLCVITGNTGTEQGAIIGTVTEALFAQIRNYGDQSMIIEDGKTFAPVRVICRDDGQLTSVFAYYSEEGELRIAATNRLPNGASSPCK